MNPDPTDGAPSGAGRRTRRRLSRELALRGLYQWRVAGGDAGTIEAQLREAREDGSLDEAYLSVLLRGVLAHAAELEERIAPHLDRTFNELSPVEAGILLLGTYELAHQPEIPYRAVINEAVELAKTYGGTDGHKYVNGVLDRLASTLRVIETGADARA